MRVYSNWNPKSSTFWIKKVEALFSSFVTLLFPLCSSSPVNTSQFSSCLNGHFGGNPTSPQPLWSQGTPPDTFLQFFPQSTNFGQPETGPVCRFCFLFSVHKNKTHSAQTWGLGCFFWTTASQDNFVCFNPLTILSSQGHISQLIAQQSHFSDDRSS